MILRPKFIKNIKLYNYLNDKRDCKDYMHIKNLLVFNKTVCRQVPSFIINKKNEIIGVKTTLNNSNLNTFLYKLKIFTLPKMEKDLILNKNFVKLDNNYNIYLILKNKTYFFEYRSDLHCESNDTFIIKISFNDEITHQERINYTSEILHINI